jgi:flagellar biosynthesis chaperone FliJ
VEVQQKKKTQMRSMGRGCSLNLGRMDGFVGVEQKKVRQARTTEGALHAEELKFPSDLFNNRIKRDRWHNLMEIQCTDRRTSSVRTEPKNLQTKTQTHKQTHENKPGGS